MVVKYYYECPDFDVYTVRMSLYKIYIKAIGDNGTLQCQLILSSGKFFVLYMLLFCKFGLF